MEHELDLDKVYVPAGVIDFPDDVWIAKQVAENLVKNARWMDIYDEIRLAEHNLSPLELDEMTSRVQDKLHEVTRVIVKWGR